MAAGFDQTGPRRKRKKRQSRKPKDRALTRSENMSRIRGKDTRPEMMVRHAFWEAGLRYRLHDKRLPGNPDLVFPGRRTVVFVHGCFWHCHEGCSNFRIPKTRTEWWAAKLERNKARDADVLAQLDGMGWDVVVIWECETADPKRLAVLTEEFKLNRNASSRPTRNATR
ncbi:MAG: Very short patch repair protein [Candidatus Accumulibacter appositus]|uniref:Very short patch repair protein n=1 Tax=Candidatus Accumulibacter appositus TaxID=1454003 RepID=A0A011PJV2_9PROT|nr:MAG: Very short patch repair protein [Candidatus Accumulibacter appositus]